MADSTAVALPPERDANTGPTSLGPPVDFDVRGLGCQLPRNTVPEGWLKRIERRREGKVWVGFFHLWSTNATGRRVRIKKEKTLGPASMPKHEAQRKLADYIEDYTGRLTKQGSAIATFTELWKAFSAVRAGRWSKKTREDLKYLFGKHVLPFIGDYAPRENNPNVTSTARKQACGGWILQIGRRAFGACRK